MTNDGGSIWAEGELTSKSSSRDLDRSAQRNLMINHVLVKSGYPADLIMQEISRSNEKNWEHYKMQQIVEGIPVWSNELTLHIKDHEFQLMGHLSREIFEQKNVVVTQSEAEVQTINELQSKGIKVFSKEKKQALALLLEDDSKELVWYAHKGKFQLAWHLTISS